MRLSILVSALSACANPQDKIGKIYSEYDWRCLKRESVTGVGLSSSGKAVVTTTSSCMAVKCFLFTKRYTKYFHELISKELVDDKCCIEKCEVPK